MSQILDALEHARRERENSQEATSSLEPLNDDVNPFDANDKHKNGVSLNPVVWLVILISIFFAVYLAVEFELSGAGLDNALQGFFSGL